MKVRRCVLRKTHVLLLIVVGIGAVLSAQAQDTPKTMTRISTRIVEPPQVANSFAAQARTLWRAGTKYGRVEEPRDSKDRLQRLTIINEPDAWTINLFDKTGRHMIDRGPSFEAHLPVFTDNTVSPELKELEFGRELAFFSKRGARESADEALDGKATTRYEVKMGNRTIVLRVYVDSKQPARVSLVGGPQTQTIEYVSYADDLPFDPSLFHPPLGIVLQDIK